MFTCAVYSVQCRERALYIFGPSRVKIIYLHVLNGAGRYTHGSMKMCIICSACCMAIFLIVQAGLLLYIYTLQCHMSINRFSWYTMASF